MPNGADKIYMVPAEVVRQFSVKTISQVGISREDAELLADTLVQADLRGVHSHGVVRIPYYVRGYEFGDINRKPQVRILHESGAMAVMDGDGGLGLVVSYPAMKLAMDKAAQYGVGVVTMCRSNHNGMIAYWAMMALERDMIGYTTTTNRPLLAPWGGITPSYGNDPCAYAIPAGKEWPIVLDMALSVAAFAKMRLLEMKNEPIPEGWAMDKKGRPTTNARAAMEGLMLPIAGYKGYGLAMVYEVLAGVLSGGIFGTDVPKYKHGYPHNPGFGHFFMAIDVAHFMLVEQFKERVDRLIRMMKESELIEGQGKIYLPGEIAFENHRKRLLEGIPYTEEIITTLRDFAQERNIPVEF